MRSKCYGGSTCSMGTKQSFATNSFHDNPVRVFKLAILFDGPVDIDVLNTSYTFHGASVGFGRFACGPVDQ